MSYDGTRHYVSGIDNPYQEFPWLPENATSLYGGVRSRVDVYSGSTSGLQVYPIDEVDTHSIDKVIGVPGQYPQTGSVNLAWMTNTEQPDESAQTDVRWYDQYWSAVDNLRDWYSTHTKHTYPSATYPNHCTVVHVPEMFYGRQIATGSVKIETHAFESARGANVWPVSSASAQAWVEIDTHASKTLSGGQWYVSLSGVRYYVDDGYGRLFDVPSGSTGSWKDAWMSGTVVRVGDVYYNEGLIVLNSTSSVWQAEFFSSSFEIQDKPYDLSIEFDGVTLMQSMVFMCRMAPGEVNASRNPTYYYTDAAGKSWAKSSGSTEGVTYVTAIGLYDQERRLVAVAKLAQPIRKRERDNIDIRLRLDV